MDLCADYSRLDTTSGDQTAAGVRVAARPIDQMKIEASYAGKQVVQGDDEQQRAVRVEAQPASFMKLSAAMGDKQTGSVQSMNREAGIEIAPSDRLRVATTYRRFGPPDAATTIRDYSGTARPVDFLEVSGAYRNREITGAGDLDSRSLKLALGRDKAPFRFTGRYAYNPEDKKGNVQRLYSTGAQIEMRLGILGLTGAYTQMDEYLAGKTSLEREVGLNLPIFGHGRLATGYKMTSSIAASEESTVTYSIGYTHDLGSRFNLSLTGELIRSDLASTAPGDEYKATAKLGIRF